MFNLPEQVGAGFAVLQVSHGQVFLGRPVARVFKANHLGRMLAESRAVACHAQLGECIALPLHFPHPAVVGNPQFHFVVLVGKSFFFNTGQSKRRDILQAQRPVAFIFQFGPAADNRHAVEELVMTFHLQVGDGII